MEKQKELHRLTKELVKQMTGRDIDDTQDADYQIAYYYLNKAINYTHCCKSDSEQLLEIEKLCRMNQNFVCNCIDDSRCPNF